MDIPTPGMVRNSGSHFDQALDQGEIVAPWKSIMMDRLKSGRIASFRLSPLAGTLETSKSLIYSAYIIWLA